MNEEIEDLIKIKMKFVANGYKIPVNKIKENTKYFQENMNLNVDKHRKRAGTDL